MWWPIFIQCVGFLAWFILVVSFRQKTEKKILAVQAVADFVYFLHYAFLGAISGALVAFSCVARGLIYYKAKNRLKAYYFFFAFYVVMILYNIFIVKNIYMAFPFIATSITGFALTLKRKEIIMGSLMASALWVWYNLLVYSISGIITETILVTSNVSVLLGIIAEEKKARATGLDSSTVNETAEEEDNKEKITSCC